MTALRERQDALDLLSSEAGLARTGSGRLVLLRGATGTGRSALLEAATAQGAEQGMRVLRARCSAAGSGTALGAVQQLLDQQPGFGPDDETPHHPDYPARLWSLLRSYAADSPLLVAVDDVHLADPSSRRWLAEAARRLDRSAVLLVVTERGQYDITPPAPGLAHALSPSLVRVHALAPLSHAAAADMVRDCSGAGATEDWVDGCVRAAAGNPLLLRALLDDLRAVFPDGATRAALPDSCADLYPGAFAAAVSWWLDSAGPGTAVVARTLAELEDKALDDGDDIGGLLAGVTGADPARVPGWVTAMIRLGLLRRDPAHGQPRFAHALLREAVLDSWPSAQRQAVHRAAAELRHRRGNRAEAVAGHLLQAPAVGAEWAADVLVDAAGGASRADRTGDAVDYLRRALDEPMARDRRANVLTELGSLEFGTVRSAGIPRLAEALRLQELPRDQVKAAVALGTALALRGQAHAAFAVLHDLDGRLPDDPALARSVQAASVLLADHDPELRQEVYTRLRRAAEQSPSVVGPAEQALLVRYEATAGLLSAEQAMRRIRALLAAPEEPPLLPYLLITAAAVAQWADELDDADRLVQRGLAGHRLSRQYLMYQALVNTRTDTTAARGRHAQVLADLGDCGLPADRAAGAGPSNLQAHAVLALVESGRLADAHRLAGSVSLRDAHDSWELNRFLYARGVLRAASDDPVGALDDFLECGRRQTARDVVSPVVTPWRSAAAECHLTLGRPAAALPLAQEEYRLAAVWNTPRVMGRALRTLGAATGGRRGLELTGRAVQTLREAALDAELVPALLSHGRQLTAAGQPGQARPLLREAAATAERLGAVRLRATAEQALRDSGARHRNARLTGSGALTGSECRVAGLAADGRTNAEIADLLHLARRTVETHLTSAYRKLGIHRRADLPAALNSEG